MIKLREIRNEDEDKILLWRNSPEISKYMYTDHKISIQEHEGWFKKILIDDSSQYWIIVCDEQDVGIANIYNIDKTNSRCYWAFYIASSNVRGKGIGSFVEYSILNYVFDELKLNKLCCEVLDFNEPVVRLHKKFGFKEEGFFRNHIYKQNKLYGIYCLGILKEEWEIIKPEIFVRLKKSNIL